MLVGTLAPTLQLNVSRFARLRISNDQFLLLSSPGLTGRSGISEAMVIKSRNRGVLDAPPEPVIGRAFARPVGGA
jgi:hypothetical protein